MTDPHIIHSGIGVPLDFGYNETNNESDCGIPSAPGCPKWVFRVKFQLSNIYLLNLLWLGVACKLRTRQLPKFCPISQIYESSQFCVYIFGWNISKRSVDGLPWVYFGDPLRCQLVGSSGSCPPGQLVFGNHNQTWFGHCDCICPEVTSSTPGTKELKLLSKWGEFYGANITEHSALRFCTLREALEVNGAMLDKETGSCYYLETRVNSQKCINVMF